VATTAARSDAITASGALVVGEMRMYGGAAAPTGWLFCDGSVISRTTYAALFAAIGTVWGAGDGTTTFGIPDMRGKTPIGVGTGTGLTARALGAYLGEETHTLSQAEMPVHQHVTHSTGSSNATHTHASVGGFSEIASPNAGNVNNILTDGAGSGSAHNVMQPSVAVNFIIKT
jgi:microcystin-dependent protein